jgi:TRAP-type C4-dicarboxylate transport system permease small subunit
MDMGLLSAEFALSASYGDMIVGLLALAMVYLLAKRKTYARALVIGWNVLGLLDFVSALTAGGMYIVPFSAQIAASGVSLFYLNYVLIVPSFGVPLYALLHIYSLFQMSSTRVDETKQDIEEPVRAPVFQGEPRSVHP